MRYLVLTACLVATGCHKYLIAQVSVTGQSPAVAAKDITQGLPGLITGSVENRGAQDVLLDSQPFVWNPAAPEQKFDFRVRTGSNVVTVLQYPGGPTSRTTTSVPTERSEKTWPFKVTISPVDLATSQEVSVKFFEDTARSLTLLDQAAGGETTPPTVTYDQVAKYIGAIAIVPKDWDPKTGVLASYIANVRVLKADPPITSGVRISRKLNIINSTAVSASLNVPVYGSIGAKVASNGVYRMNFDVTHNAIFDLDQQTFSTLLDPRNQAGNAAMADLEFWAAAYPEARLLVLRAVRYIVNSTIGLTQGKKYDTSIDVAVASMFTSNAAYSYSLDDEESYSLTGSVTAWKWKLHDLTLEQWVKYLREQRAKSTRSILPPDHPLLRGKVVGLMK